MTRSGILKRTFDNTEKQNTLSIGNATLSYSWPCNAEKAMKSALVQNCNTDYGETDDDTVKQ